MHPVGPLLICVAAATLLTSCSDVRGSTAPPSWESSPSLGVAGDGPGAQVSPIIPIPSGRVGGPGGAGSSGPVPGNAGSVPPRRVRAHRDPNVVATHLSSPVGLALLPDGSALVGERTTGRIVQVQPRPGQPVPTIRVLHGLDTSGDGGLLDLVLSPTYGEDGLVYAYLTTATDNRVVDFTLTGPVTPVLTGIPKGRTGNTGRIAFGGDGNLYVGTGDAGRPRLAARTDSLAGKVLRVDQIGDPPRSNPLAHSPVWTTGHRVVNGLCVLPRTTALFEVETGAAGTPDEVNLLDRGAYYGWPAPQAGSAAPIARLPRHDASPGGCAVLNNRLWITSLTGESLLSAPLRPGPSSPTVGAFSAALEHRYGRLRTVVAADDGALWLTTANREGQGEPAPADERVIRYLPSGGAGHSTL